MVKKITSTEYKKLVPIIAAYRENLKQYCKIESGKHYARVYTEQRVYGARTKFWLAVFADKTLKAINKYVKANPTVTVGKCTYEVSVQAVAPLQPWRSIVDHQLVFSCK